jgi:hypothetical protein
MVMRIYKSLNMYYSQLHSYFHFLQFALNYIPEFKYQPNVALLQITNIMFSSVLPISQWNPALSLNIESAPEGGLYCAGNKSAGGPCRWVLKDKNLLAYIDDIATLSPKDAIIHLQDLADHALCKHHINQKWEIVRRWTATINDSWQILPAPNAVELHGSLPNRCAVTAAKPTLSSSSSWNGATPQHLDSTRCISSSSLDFWDKRLQDLESKVEHMRSQALPLKGHPRKSSGKLWAKLTRLWMRIISSTQTLL